MQCNKNYKNYIKYNHMQGENSITITLNNQEPHKSQFYSHWNILKLFKTKQLKQQLKGQSRDYVFLNQEKITLKQDDLIKQKCFNSKNKTYSIIIKNKVFQNTLNISLDKKDQMFISLFNFAFQGNFQKIQQNQKIHPKIKQSLIKSIRSQQQNKQKTEKLHKEKFNRSQTEKQTLKLQNKNLQEKILLLQKKLQQNKKQISKSKETKDKTIKEIQKLQIQKISQQNKKTNQIQNLKKQVQKAIKTSIQADKKIKVLQNNNRQNDKAGMIIKSLNIFKKNSNLTTYFCNRPQSGKKLIDGINNFFCQNTTQKKIIKQITMVHSSIIVTRHSDFFNNIVNISDLLLVCLTKQGSLIGAYTNKPIAVDAVLSNQKEAFLFNLHPTKMQFNIFPCKKDVYVTTYDVDYICFGNKDIQIQKCTNVLTSDFSCGKSITFEKFTNNFLTEAGNKTEVQLQFYQLYKIQFENIK